MLKKSKPTKLLGMSYIKVKRDYQIGYSLTIMEFQGLTKKQAQQLKEEIVRRYNNYRP